MSKKRKLNKFLKRVAPLALAGFGAAMLGRRKQMKDFLATEGGDRSNMISRPNMMDIAGSMIRKPRFNPAMMLQGVGMDPVIEGIQAGAKKGGRIMKTKKGFKTC
jgi:hypothetical protein